MASELPLNLFSCSYSDDDCQWIYEPDALQYVISSYQTLWAENNIKLVSEDVGSE